MLEPKEGSFLCLCGGIICYDLILYDGYVIIRGLRFGR